MGIKCVQHWWRGCDSCRQEEDIAGASAITTPWVDDGPQVCTAGTCAAAGLSVLHWVGWNDGGWQRVCGLCAPGPRLLRLSGGAT